MRELAAQPTATTDSAQMIPRSAVFSMGQPPQWMPYVAAGGIFAPHGRAGGNLLLGVHRPVGSPVIGFGLNAEVYGTFASQSTGGLRLLAAARALNTSVGVDWDAQTQTSRFLMSWSAALRRGGVFGGGSMIRVDWLPARTQSFAIGLTTPLHQPFAGRTRPSETGVDLPLNTPVTDLTSVLIPRASIDALSAVREAASLLTLYSAFFNETGGSRLAASDREFRTLAKEARDSLRVKSVRFPRGRSYAETYRVYSTALARALDEASLGDRNGNESGENLVRENRVGEARVGEARVGEARVGEARVNDGPLAVRARAGLLDHVLLPYDTLFGRVKNQQRSIEGLTTAAQSAFARWLRDSSDVPATRQQVVLAVHARWLSIISEQQRALVRQWHDSRRIWLPLQFALAPEDYDEQREVDALIARAVGRPFSDGNALTLVQSTDLPTEFARSILAARDYHVLWIHDFVGRGTDGAIDRIGFDVVAKVYFPALTRAVERYAETGHFTTFQIFLDENFYAVRDGRLWMTILENPLDATIRLPAENAADEAELRERQQELRNAVASSKQLQLDAARNGGDKFLRDIVKVNVNITQPSDFSFRSHRLLPPISFLPDNLMRDHRKIAFYDLTEADPYRGAMVIGGVGIGEQYSTPAWDDRGLVLSGPAAVEVRAAARRLLRLNGFADNDVPEVLRDATTTVAGAPPTASLPPADGRAYAVRALQVHNEPGFGRKQSSVARAMLYNLAPSGSVIVVPDPLWLGSEWAGMLAGAALRGCRVLIIAPSASNSPNSQGFVLAQTADVLSRLLEIQAVFGEDIAKAGGELRVGVYAAKEPVNDVEREVQEALRGLKQAPWLRTLIPFDSATITALDSVSRLLRTAGYQAVAPSELRTPQLPKLHAKMQFVAAPEALAALTRQPGWADIFGRWLIARALQTSHDAILGGLSAAYDSVGLRDRAAELLAGYSSAQSEVSRRLVSFYLTSGTQNEDARGMMLDGEAQLVISGEQAAAALPDFYLLMARTTWITNQKELDAHYPHYSALMRWIARNIRFVL